MRKVVIAFVIVLVLIGAAIAFALSNLNSYLAANRDWLADQVKQSLGRDVGFEEVSVSLSAGVGARVTKLRIADDPAFSKEDFLRADDVRVSVRIWPALFGRYEVSSIVLDQPSLTVIRGPKGFNFDSIGKKPGGEPAEKPEGKAKREKREGAEDEDAPEAAPAAFLVSQTEIRSGRLRYVDMTAKPTRDLVVEQLDFDASDVSFESPIELEIAAALLGSTKQNAKLTGTIGPLGSPPNPQKAPLDMKAEIGPLVIDELKKLAAIGDAVPKELSSPDPVSLEAQISGTVDNPGIQLSFDLSDAAIRYGDFRKPDGTKFKLDLAAKRSGETLQLEKLALALADLELQGKGTVTTGDPGRVDLRIDSNRAPLSGWDEMLPALEGHDVSGNFEVHLHAKGATGGGATPAVDGTVTLDGVNARLKDSPHEIEGLSTKIELKGDSVVVPPTKFQLGGSPLELEAKIESLKSRSGTFALRSPGLRAASLGVGGEEVAKEEVIRGLDLSGSFQAPEGRAPLFQGVLRSTEGTLRDIDYQALRASFGLREEVATLEKLSLRAFEGTYDGAGRYDMREPESPQFDFRSTIRDMGLKNLLGTQFPGSEKRIEGRLDANLDLTGSGKEWEQIRQNLRGDGRLDVREGVIRDVNIAEQVLGGVTGVPGLSNFISPRTREKYPELFETGDTNFDKLGGSVQIADGVARTEDLTMSARDYSILGSGTYALDNNVDFTATLVASEKLTRDVVDDVKEAKYLANEQGRIAIPFRLQGPMPGAKPKPDTQYIARAIGRAAVERGIEKGLDKLLGGKRREPPPDEALEGDEEELGDTDAPEEGREPSGEELLRKGLEGLFGR